MSNVGCLVGVDAGVFDQNLVLRSSGDTIACDHLSNKLPAIETSVDVTCSRKFKCFESWNAPKRADNFLGGFPRRFAQALRKLKSQGQREFAKSNLWGLFDDNTRKLQFVLLAQECAYAFGKGLLEVKVQESSVAPASECMPGMSISMDDKIAIITIALRRSVTDPLTDAHTLSSLASSDDVHRCESFQRGAGDSEDVVGSGSV